MPTSLNQKSWCKLFGCGVSWTIESAGRLDATQVGSCHPARFRALLSSPFRRCLLLMSYTKYPLCQQSDLAATFGGRLDKQARFPVRHTKAQNLSFRGDPFHSKRCLGTKNRCDLCVPHPCCTMSLRILHLCLLRGLGKDGHTLAQHIGFCKNHSKCRVFQVHVQVRHRHDAAACAVALSTGDKKNKMRCLPKAQKSVTCKLVRTSKFKTHACSRKIFGTQGRWLSSKSAINAGFACTTSNWHSWGVLTSAGDACDALSDSCVEAVDWEAALPDHCLCLWLVATRTSQRCQSTTPRCHAYPLLPAPLCNWNSSQTQWELSIWLPRHAFYSYCTVLFACLDSCCFSYYWPVLMSKQLNFVEWKKLWVFHSKHVCFEWKPWIAILFIQKDFLNEPWKMKNAKTLDCFSFKRTLLNEKWIKYQCFIQNMFVLNENHGLMFFIQKDSLEWTLKNEKPWADVFSFKRFLLNENGKHDQCFIQNMSVLNENRWLFFIFFEWTLKSRLFHSKHVSFECKTLILWLWNYFNPL